MSNILTRSRYQKRRSSLVVCRLAALRESISCHLQPLQKFQVHRLLRPPIMIYLQTSLLTTQQAAQISIPLKHLNHGRHNSSTSTPSSTTFNSNSISISRSYEQASLSRRNFPTKPTVKHPDKASTSWPVAGKRCKNRVELPCANFALISLQLRRWRWL